MKENKSLVRRVFGFIWATVVTLYRVVVVLLLLLGLVLLWFTFRGGPPPVVEDKVALVVWPSGRIVEQMDHDPSAQLFRQISGEKPHETELADLVEAFEAAAGDPRIRVAVLQLDDLTGASMPQLDELKVAMSRFQSAGKPIYVHAVGLDQMGYYAAAQADDLSIDTFGLVLIQGFGVYQNYFKDALDKLGVQMHVFRVGEYKSAVEPLLRNDMSDEAKAANKAWLDDLWAHYGGKVAESRELDASAVDRYVGDFADGLKAAEGRASLYAESAGLIDRTETVEQFRERVGAVVGMDDDHHSFRQIHHADYLRAVHHEQALHPASASKRVARVVIEGNLVDGIGDPGQAGGDTISQLLREALYDEDVAAVLLRVNSPGGSVWASEQIRRSVKALRTAGKPVVVSMSTVAASGGYWVSMDADQIWAHESTITGSIGIFGIIPTIEEPLRKLGISTDGVGTTPLAGAMRLDRPLSPQVASIIQSQIDRGYHDFVEGVAQGRNLTVEQVQELARGRVWSGSAARDLGLVDAFGGQDDALSAAAGLAGLVEGQWELEEFQPQYDFPIEWLGRLFGTASLELPWLPDSIRSWLKVSDLRHALPILSDPQGMYAYCYCTPSLGGASDHLP